MLFPCIMIGLANAAIVILQDANIMDTIVHALASTLNNLHASMMACGMFVVQDIFNVLVPSGSGQAAITMPIMAPLADMLGVTRQTAVLAFQMGDAFTNVLAPTGGEILAALAMCKTPYGKWVKYLLPLLCYVVDRCFYLPDLCDEDRIRSILIQQLTKQPIHINIPPCGPDLTCHYVRSAFLSRRISERSANTSLVISMKSFIYLGRYLSL